jgi:hypothetical protein
MCTAICVVAHAEGSAPLKSIVGLWQFPDRGVWIKIDADGSAYQCRHAPSGTLFTSKGTYVSPGAIRWDDIWDTDEVSIKGDVMTLAGKWGTFSYARAEDPMYERCLGKQGAQ